MVAGGVYLLQTAHRFLGPAVDAGSAGLPAAPVLSAGGRTLAGPASRSGPADGSTQILWQSSVPRPVYITVENSGKSPLRIEVIAGSGRHSKRTPTLVKPQDAQIVTIDGAAPVLVTATCPKGPGGCSYGWRVDDAR
jgi:hypothetical protein